MSTKTLKRSIDGIELRYTFSGSNNGSAFSRNWETSAVEVLIVDPSLRTLDESSFSLQEKMRAYESSIVYKATAGRARSHADADKIARRFVREHDLRNHAAFRS